MKTIKDLKSFICSNSGECKSFGRACIQSYTKGDQGVLSINNVNILKLYPYDKDNVWIAIAPKEDVGVYCTYNIDYSNAKVINLDTKISDLPHFFPNGKDMDKIVEVLSNWS